MKVRFGFSEDFRDEAKATKHGDKANLPVLLPAKRKCLDHDGLYVEANVNRNEKKNLGDKPLNSQRRTSPE